MNWLVEKNFGLEIIHIYAPTFLAKGSGNIENGEIVIQIKDGKLFDIRVKSEH